MDLDDFIAECAHSEAEAAAADRSPLAVDDQGAGHADRSPLAVDDQAAGHADPQGEKIAPTFPPPPQPLAEEIATINKMASGLCVPAAWLRNWIKQYTKPLPVVSIRGTIHLYPMVTYAAIVEQQGAGGIQVKNPCEKKRDSSASTTPKQQAAFAGVPLRDLFRVEALR